MQAVLTNFGTTGDVQPFLALACEMKRRGHEAILALSPGFRERVEKLGLQFHPVGPDLKDVQRNIISSMLEVKNTTEQLRSLFAPLTSALPQAVADLTEACRSADVVVSGPAQPAARIIHEKTGINFASVQLTLLYGSGSPALKEASAGLINPFREKLGLPALANPLTIDANSPQLALYAVSRHVMPPPADWPAHHHMTGYFFLEEAEWEPDRGLVEFISGGEAPVVFAFGSTTHQSPETLTGIILDTVKRVGCRAIIQHGWSGLATRRLPPDVLGVGYVPHEWLFERARCVVHHGGAGTIAATFRTGTPSIFITHGPSFRAELASELGCVGAILPYWELNSDDLASSLTTTLSNGACYRAAKLLAEKIRAERGVENACMHIEKLVGCAKYDAAGELEEDTDSSTEDRRKRITRRRSYQQQRRSSNHPRQPD